MTNAERRKMVVNAIRRLEDKLCSLKHCEYDGAMSFREREEEAVTLQKHLRCAHSVLVMLNEEDLEIAS